MNPEVLQVVSSLYAVNHTYEKCCRKHEMKHKYLNTLTAKKLTDRIAVMLQAENSMTNRKLEENRIYLK